MSQHPSTLSNRDLWYRREASYLLTRYFSTDSYRPHSGNSSESHPRVEYDPPWHPSVTLPASAGRNSVGGPTNTERAPCSEIVIELGSGMGTAGLAVAEALKRLQLASISAGCPTGSMTTHANSPERFVGAQRVISTSVVLTDLPEVCPLLRENVSMQSEDWKKAGLGGTTMVDEPTDECQNQNRFDLRVRELSWGNEDHVQVLSKELQALQPAPAIGEGTNLTIICSDLVYFPHLLGPLLRTLIRVTSPSFLPNASARAKVIMSCRIRSFSKETPFWRAFGRWFTFRPVLEQRAGEFVWRRLGWDETAPSFVFIAHRRPETLAWRCPGEDHEVLYGLGGDDTLEILLMMCNEALND